MRIDLSDLKRLDGIAEGLGRLFWCLIGIALLAAILGTPGTGLLLLVLGGVAFVVQTGIEDFVRARRERKKRARPKPKAAPRRTKPVARRRTKSAV